MKVLIIEDQKALADALSEILKSSGYHTDTVYDGNTGLEYAVLEQYDMIILDLMLPGLDGFEVLSQFRRNNTTTPVLILTARNTVPDKVKGLNKGADDYMTKPFDTQELLARVNALTRRKGSMLINEITYGDMVLNLDSAELKCQDQSVQLSRTEFDVAKFMLSNPQTTITKDQLLEQVWGPESDATYNNVEAYISFLRKKLRYLKSEYTIKNIQKIGYRFEVNRNE